MNGTPITPEQTAESVKKMCNANCVKRLCVETKYGSIELPMNEIWFADSTDTIHLSVQIPAGYEFIKLP